MEYLFGLVFTLLKVSVQAFIYATLILLLTKIGTVFSSNSGIAKLTINDKRIWWSSAFAALIALCFIANTHWGDHGLGDSSRIPLSFNETMEQMNGVTTYFPPLTTIDQPEVKSYKVKQDVLCAQTGDDSYFVYDLISKQHQNFPDSTVYNRYAALHHLPTSAQFESFWTHYARYWGGWRFWLLA